MSRLAWPVMALTIGTGMSRSPTAMVVKVWRSVWNGLGRTSVLRMFSSHRPLSVRGLMYVFRNERNMNSPSSTSSGSSRSCGSGTVRMLFSVLGRTK